ncbi:MAG: RNA polymerase sigma factor RpoE [Gammaproteobacteria bacterium]|nr:MAG: RNA polymerase sigma factor RpoE [Gammaproteobacteria bacterium]
MVYFRQRAAFLRGAKSRDMSERSVDQKLVVRVQKGDKTAFDLLVRKYQHKVSNLVARYVRDRGEVEDVAQEAFIKAYRAIGGFRGDSAFYTWLYRITVNTAKNYLDSQGRRPPSSDVELNGAELIESGEALRDQATPEHSILTKEIAATVHRVIEALPVDLRAAITLREIEGLSYEEIAQVMDCPIGTVRSRIFRARDAIDKELKPLLEI